MKLEHRSQKVVPFAVFLKRVLRYSFFSFLLIGFSIEIGIWGYQRFAHISWIDSFYMSTMILTGMGPTIEMPSDTAKLFSAFYALYSGIVFLCATAVFFSPILHRIFHILHVDIEDEK